MKTLFTLSFLCILSFSFSGDKKPSRIEQKGEKTAPAYMDEINPFIPFHLFTF